VTTERLLFTDPPATRINTTCNLQHLYRPTVLPQSRVASLQFYCTVRTGLEQEREEGEIILASRIVRTRALLMPGEDSLIGGIMPDQVDIYTP
jgi:hypothetical protein